MAEHDLDMLFKPKFAALSRHGSAVGCAMEEHVMFQEARGFEVGAERWRVTHNSENGIYDIEVRGEPPATFAAIRDALVAQQDAEGGEDAGVDIISDIPLDLAESICGFRHDHGWPSDLSFAEVGAARRAAPASGPGFFARLFGRK